jgi:beta-glucanase (GH16 family)
VTSADGVVSPITSDDRPGRRGRWASRVAIVLLTTALLAACTSNGPRREGSGAGATRPSSTTGRSSAAPAEPIASHLLWSDEFNGSSLDTTMWKPYHNTYGAGNGELQCEQPSNVTESGGDVEITARRQSVKCPNGSVHNFSSGFIGTRETGHYFPRYGRYEIRAQLPEGQGLWPAFWLRHRDGAARAEVDIMEYFESADPGETTATLHLDGRLNLSKQSVRFEGASDGPKWHIWAVDIHPDPAGVRFTFSLDGTPYHSYVDTQHLWANSTDPAATWDIALNLSVGGTYVGDPDGPLGYLNLRGHCARNGSPPSRCGSAGVRRASFPATYRIDYIRVYADS